eukprot:976800-Rhodomonas_salina.7
MALAESERLRRAEAHRSAADLAARDRLLDQLKHQVLPQRSDSGRCPQQRAVPPRVTSNTF